MAVWLYNKRNRRWWEAKKENENPTREPLKLRILLVIFQFYRSVGFRGAPWGSGGRPAGAPINAQHPTRKLEINETTADGWRRKEKQKDEPGTPKIQDPICNFPILLLRGAPRGSGGRSVGGTLTPNAETRNKRNHRGWVTKKGKQKAAPRIPKIKDSMRIFEIYRSVAFLGVPGGGARGRPLSPNTQRGNAK